MLSIKLQPLDDLTGDIRALRPSVLSNYQRLWLFWLRPVPDLTASLNKSRTIPDRVSCLQILSSTLSVVWVYLYLSQCIIPYPNLSASLPDNVPVFQVCIVYNLSGFSRSAVYVHAHSGFSWNSATSARELISSQTLYDILVHMWRRWAGSVRFISVPLADLVVGET